MAISPISGSMPQINGVGSASPMREPAAPKTSFGETFQSALNKVETQQDASSAAVSDLLTGKTVDVMPVVSAVAKADMSFKLLIGVRNKVIEAYKQTMNMQV